MRGYVSKEEYISFWTERQKIRSEIKKDEEVAEKFEQKYGPESEWSEQVQENHRLEWRVLLRQPRTVAR